MNPNDYDEDGNNIVPCPLCLDVYCPSKDGGKCPEEDDFVRAMAFQKAKDDLKKSFLNALEPILLPIMDKLELWLRKISSKRKGNKY